MPYTMLSLKQLEQIKQYNIDINNEKKNSIIGEYFKKPKSECEIQKDKFKLIIDYLHSS